MLVKVCGVAVDAVGDAVSVGLVLFDTTLRKLKGRLYIVLVGCLQYTYLSWVGNIHVNIIMKPTNSRSEGQPNPRNIRLNLTIGPLFPPQQIVFRGLGLVLYCKQATRNLTQPDSRQTP